LYEFSLSVDIAASTARVWRALCHPAEVVTWDSNVVEALDAPPDYPRPGQHVRWRCRGGPFRVLHDKPQQVVPERRLRSRLALGPYRYDETYTLEPDAEGCTLTLRLVVTTAIPLIGGLIQRLYLEPETRRAFTRSLAALKHHCEAP
jgi:uncharacterized protein YndB with AHSA1/START domain